MKENDDLEIIIKYAEAEKIINLPKDIDSFIENVKFLFNISLKKDTYLQIYYKNSSGNRIQILNQEDYHQYIQTLEKKQIPNIIYISIEKISLNQMLPYKNDLYDIDDNNEEEMEYQDEDKKGNLKNKLNIDEILSESVIIDKTDKDEEIKEEKIDEIKEEKKDENIFQNEIIRSLIPPVISFPSFCNMCQKFPITKIMYYCTNCDMNLCEECEKIFGVNHRHTYYKIRNKEQYQQIINMNFDNNNNENKIHKNKTKLEIIKEKKEGIKNFFSSVIQFISGNENNNI